MNYLDVIEQKYENEIMRFDNLYENEKILKYKKHKEILVLKLDECRKYRNLVSDICSFDIYMDLEDGVVCNYEKLQNIKFENNQTLFR